MNRLFTTRLIHLGCLLAAACPAFAADTASRTWTDNSGKFTIDAALVRVADQTVILVTGSGDQIRVPLNRLSDADRKYLADQQRSSTTELKFRYEQPKKFRMRIGMEAKANGGPVNNLICTFPLPMEWPEQKVTVVDRAASPSELRVTTKILNDGVEQVEFRVPRLAAEETASVVYTLDIERFQIVPPEDTDGFVFADQLDRDIRRYLTESPFIETDHRKVKAAADQIQLNDADSAWQQVETIYDWTRSKVKWNGTKPLKGALGALESGTGDCEEITSLFVAMCRLKGIPARSVWVDGHAYPEFYLQDGSGAGHWIPCESLGARSFGRMNRYQVLMQKGDNFRMSQKREPQRYVTPTISGSAARGGGQISLHEVRELLP